MANTTQCMLKIHMQNAAQEELAIDFELLHKELLNAAEYYNNCFNNERKLVILQLEAGGFNLIFLAKEEIEAENCFAELDSFIQYASQKGKISEYIEEGYIIAEKEEAIELSYGQVMVLMYQVGYSMAESEEILAIFNSLTNEEGEIEEFDSANSLTGHNEGYMNDEQMISTLQFLSATKDLGSKESVKRKKQLIEKTKELLSVWLYS